MERATLYRQLPYLKKTIWSGEILAKRYGGNDWGEAYLLSSLKEKSSRMSDHCFFSQCWRQHCDEEYPYLIKYIDVKTSLSIQVHPGGNSHQRGKNELWLIDKVRPGGKIYRGFRSGMDPEQWLDCDDKDFLSLMQSENVAAGDTVFIPGGMIHGAEGISFYEIQDPLDVTYRLFDYGRGRTLQREEGRQALKAAEHLPDSHLFSLHRQRFLGDFCMKADAHSFLLFIAGNGILKGMEEDPFSAGDCFFVAEGGNIVICGQGTLIYGTI